jgi:hypothetical protein
VELSAAGGVVLRAVTRNFDQAIHRAMSRTSMAKELFAYRHIGHPDHFGHNDNKRR